MSKKNLCLEGGFSSLSVGAQEIARYHDEHDGSISLAIKENPSLIDSLDEYYEWAAVTLGEIEGKNTLKEHFHPLKKVLKKDKK